MARILVVDDDPINRELIAAYLARSPHQLVEAESGERALALAQSQPFDLVLLDVTMAGIDGFEVTRRLKLLSADQFLPVVLVTALSDHGSRLRGLEAGADEFLTKPVDRHELDVRIANLLALRDKERALARRNLELVELQRFRDEMSALIVHDLKNPLSVILANADYLLESDLDEAAWREAAQDSKVAGRRLLRLITNLLDLTKLEAGRLQLNRRAVSIAELVTLVVEQRHHQLQLLRIQAKVDIDPALRIRVDADLVTRIIENVFDNALRHTPAGGVVEIRVATAHDDVQIFIGNSGPPVPLEARQAIFEKFAQASSSTGRMNLGLGLYFCRMAAEAHGGRIWVEQQPTLPTVFGVELPMG